MFNHQNVQALRLQRQYLSRRANKAEYDDLFRKMSPFQSGGWVAPGTAPALPGHALFEDRAWNEERRRERKILKGRFGTRIGYAAEEDWELFACLYHKEKKTLSFAQREMLELLKREGPLNIGLIKEYTRMLVKHITPVLHQLQAAFLVYEDQISNEGDRGWYAFEEEFPHVNLNRYSKTEALCEVLLRYAHLMVFFDADMAANYYQFSRKEINSALEILCREEKLVIRMLEGKSGFLLPEDEVCLQKESFINHQKGIVLLERNDFLISSLPAEQKQKWSTQWEILYYILIDGEIKGAVVGKFKFGPHIIEDIIIDLPQEEAQSRRGEVLDAVYRIFSQEQSPAHRYCGKPTL